MMPICFVDTETTGLHRGKRLWEVAIIRRDFDNQPVGEYAETRYETFVPVDLSDADLHGLNVGRFYERHPMGKWLAGRATQDDRDVVSDWEDFPLSSVRSIARDIAKMTHGCRFIGAAPSFDAEVLGDFLRAERLIPTWHHRLVDTHDLVIGYLKGIGKGYGLADGWYDVKKDELSEMLGVKPHNDLKLVHTAMGDAQHEADIWDAVMQ